MSHMSLPQGPGKTTPRFIQDVLSYDPANPPSSSFNLLTQFPPPFHDPDNYPELISPKACPHQYITKANQTELPPEGFQAGLRTPFKVSAVCLICRYHLEIKITHTTEASHCPSQLHHIVYSHSDNRQDSNPFRQKGQRLEAHYFRCSYPTCAAAISLKLLSPILTPHWVDLLTNTELLKARTDAAMEAYPERLEGHSRPLPITVLTNLRTYIENALHDSQRSKSISKSNKRFVVCFGVDGQPCHELLEFLEFQPREDVWEPPRPSTSDLVPYQNILNIFLDNVSSELLAFIYRRPAYEKEGQQPGTPLDPAIGKFNQLLGSSTYDRAYPPITANPEIRRAPYYEDLGVTDDMSADLIIEAYNRQIETDPGRSPYYLRCLRHIGEWRRVTDGEKINNLVTLECSGSRYADDDIPRAYKYFQLDYRNRNLTDDDIIDSFFARLRDTANDTETRRQLWRIGESRGSEKIKSVAEERLSTVEQALVYLGVENDTSDDFIVSMYAAKVNDQPATKELARKAIALIAEARNSDSLKYFLTTGEAAATEMDVGEAFRLLQIPDRTVDDAAILAAFSVCCSEAPGQIEAYRRALGVIGREKGSALISSTLGQESTQANRVLKEWPVGLQNIGNTCYLNSLLQFYFTVTPFRKMVIHFDDYKMPLDETSLERKKIGSRKVSIAEIERSQRFLLELQLLFKKMITSPTSSVIPEQELARLTLISSSNEAAIRRKSLITSTRPNLGEINGMPILGPLGPITTVTTEVPKDVVAGASNQKVEPSDGDSDITLVSLTAQADNEEPSIDNKENVGPAPQDSSIDAKEIVDSNDTRAATGDSIRPPSSMGPPSRPPPVPPRPISLRQEPVVNYQQQLRDEVELGAQQDVTEVINNVLFQTQCAVKPIRFDQDGEQLDVITDLFYGKTVSYITAENGVRSKEESWSDIKIDVATGSKNIYSAIDGAFDVQKVEVDGAEVEQYGTISKLPPILQIQVQRVQFDQVKKASFKSTHHLALKETIYLDRYMDSNKHNLDERRRECWRWKDELRKLRARKAELIDTESWTCLPDVFTETKVRIQSLMSIGDDPELADEALELDDTILYRLTAVQEMVQDEIKCLEAREKDLIALIESQFTDLRHLPYRLYAVFMHHGSVEFGHYYIYIFDYDKNIWRKYNDGEVTEVQSKSEIFESQNLTNPPTPYFLIYVNDRMKDRLVKPVNREIEDVSPTGVLSQPAPAPAPSVVVRGHQANGPGPSQTSTSPSGEIEMEEPPAYNEIENVPAGMDCANGQNGTVDGNGNKYTTKDTATAASAVAATAAATTLKGKWNKKFANIPSVSW
ncbi:ubiquitin carboxyl-terminal hydrolase [Histoplasma ohiense]|nr:ubiquitin carboxyl-terminal hydrolase [Histoplasma ohiense (nom. inval.)]